MVTNRNAIDFATNYNELQISRTGATVKYDGFGENATIVIYICEKLQLVATSFATTWTPNSIAAANYRCDGRRSDAARGPPDMRGEEAGPRCGRARHLLSSIHSYTHESPFKVSPGARIGKEDAKATPTNRANLCADRP